MGFVDRTIHMNWMTQASQVLRVASGYCGATLVASSIMHDDPHVAGVEVTAHSSLWDGLEIALTVLLQHMLFS